MSRSISKHCPECLQTKKFWRINNEFVCETCRYKMYPAE